MNTTKAAEDTTPRDEPPGRERSSAAATIGRQAERFALVGVWVIVIVIFGFAEPDTFMTTANFQTIFGSQSVVAVLTLALVPPLVAGDYDLSVGGTMGLSAMLIAVLNAKHGWPIGLAIATALAAAIVVGAFNGAFIVYLGVDSLIATLGSGTVLAGLVLWMSDSATITGVSDFLIEAVITTKLFGISLVFFYALGIALVLWYFLEYTTVGRRLLFVGRGRTVARLSGIPVGRMRIGALIASAFIAAIAGAFYAGTTGSADPTSSQTYLLPAFAAAFLGATCIYPGRFNPWGALVAVYFLVTGITGLQLLGAQSFVQNLFYGGALLVGVGASQLIAGRAPKQTT